MKRNEGKYEVVERLPDGAMTVTEYSEYRKMSQSNIYKKIERKTADYKIITFKTMNFIIPLTNN